MILKAAKQTHLVHVLWIWILFNTCSRSLGFSLSCQFVGVPSCRKWCSSDIRHAPRSRSTRHYQLALQRYNFKCIRHFSKSFRGAFFPYGTPPIGAVRCSFTASHRTVRCYLWWKPHGTEPRRRIFKKWIPHKPHRSTLTPKRPYIWNGLTEYLVPGTEWCQIRKHKPLWSEI